LFGTRSRVAGDFESDDSAFDRSDKLLVDVVMMTLVARRIVFPGKFDPGAFHVVDGPDVNSVLTNYFHMFLDFGHGIVPPYSDNAEDEESLLFQTLTLGRSCDRKMIGRFLLHADVGLFADAAQ
jgi:hypothetical protein